MKPAKPTNAPTAPTAITASDADIVLWEIPRSLYQKPTPLRRKASGVFIAEQMCLEARKGPKGRYALTFPKWPTGKEYWEVEDFCEFLEGFLWGQDTANGAMTAYHAQRIMKMFVNEEDFPDEIDNYFGRYQLLAIAYDLPREQDKEGVWRFKKEDVVKRYNDIMADTYGSAPETYASNLEILRMILDIMGDTEPFFVRDPEKGAFLAQGRHPGRKVLPLFKTADLASIYLEKIAQMDGVQFFPQQLFEENLYLEFSAARFAGATDVDLWLDETTRHAIEGFYRAKKPPTV